MAMLFCSMAKVFAYAFCFFLPFVNFCFGCSPIEGAGPDSMEKKFFHSDYVVYGKVLRHLAAPRPGYDSVYTAEMEVFCTFKGYVLPKKINISDAGFVPGLCHSTDLTVGTEFTVFLNHVGEGNEMKYVPIYKEDKVDDQYLEEISMICEHDINYPLGVKETEAAVTCPENYKEYADCISYSPEEEPEPVPEGEAVIDVKPLSTRPTAIIVPNDGEGAPSIRDNGENGSDVKRVSSLLIVCVLAWFL